MSEIPRISLNLADSDDYARLTCDAYSASAEEYAEATEEYDNYPGLRAAVFVFESQVPTRHMILDLGCGGGRDVRSFVSLGRRVIAGDISLEVLQSARTRSTPGGPGKAAYVRLNMLDLPFRNESIGGVWACASLLHLPLRYLPKALSEIHRSLVVGGFIAISMLMGGSEGWKVAGSVEDRRWFTLVDPSQFQELIVRTGFRSVAVNYVGREGWFIASGRK